jgi:hypothetical protein
LLPSQGNFHLLTLGSSLLVIASALECIYYFIVTNYLVSPRISPEQFLHQEKMRQLRSVQQSIIVDERWRVIHVVGLWILTDCRR